MKALRQRIAICAILFVFVLQAAALAASANTKVSGIRFSSGAERYRIVFDVDKLPEYNVTVTNNGTRILLDFSDTDNKTGYTDLKVNDDTVQNVSFLKAADKFRVEIQLSQPAEYKVRKLENPSRIFIDIQKEYEKKTSEEVAPGLVHTTYVRRDGNGMLTAHLLDVDSSRYQLKPALSNGIIAGRETVSGISDDNNALAAINASYFELSGAILGLTKIDGKIVSTTYLARSAFGIMPDGKPVVGKVDYNGTVTSGKIIVPIDGVNCERGENNLVLYNSYFDAATGTNAYGIEYTVKNGYVTAINTANSPIPADGVVISAHGTAKDALAKVKVGDKMTISENIGTPWNQAQQILGVGPMLLSNGQVNVTSKEEQFGSDVAGGRAPRTAVGLLPNGHVLLTVVDGRQSSSIGCTLTELGALMKSFGATDAVNFDGGGSSEIVIGGAIINSPSDGTERRVGSALLVMKKS